jgi:heme exporter protein D
MIFGVSVIIVVGFILNNVLISQRVVQQVNLQSREQQQTDVQAKQAHLRISPRWLA